MNDAQYETLIADFCTHVGIREWQEVLRYSHIEVDGTVIGLMPDPSPGADRLCVYIDLGPVYHARDARIHERMLIANLKPRGDLAGCFGLHPVTGNAAYQMSLQLPLGGAELAVRLRDALDQVGSCFDAMQTSQTSHNDWMRP